MIRSFCVTMSLVFQASLQELFYQNGNVDLSACKAQYPSSTVSGALCVKYKLTLFGPRDLRHAKSNVG